MVRAPALTPPASEAAAQQQRGAVARWLCFPNAIRPNKACSWELLELCVDVDAGGRAASDTEMGVVKRAVTNPQPCAPPQHPGGRPMTVPPRPPPRGPRADPPPVYPRVSCCFFFRPTAMRTHALTCLPGIAFCAASRWAGLACSPASLPAHCSVFLACRQERATAWPPPPRLASLSPRAPRSRTLGPKRKPVENLSKQLGVG